MALTQTRHEKSERRAHRILDEIKQGSGRVPSIFSFLGRSPESLEAIYSQIQALECGSLSPRMREAIALRVSQINGSDYCLAAHTTRAVKFGIPYSDTIDFRIGVSDDPAEQAVLDLVESLMTRQRITPPRDFDDLARQGLTEEERIEVIANIGLYNTLNFLSTAAGFRPDAPPAQRISPSEERSRRGKPV